MKKILIVQRRLTHYRVPLFTKLRESFDQDINIDFLYGTPSNSEISKNDSGELYNSISVRNKYFKIFGVELCWIPFSFNLIKYELIIIPNEVRIISNFFLILFCKLLSIKIAFWGHGDNYQSKSRNKILKFFRSIYSNSVDAWFVYTVSGRENLIKYGFKSHKIHVLNNSIEVEYFDFNEFHCNVKYFKDNRSFIRDDSNIYGLFLGSLYKEKRLDFVLEASIKIKKELPGFQLLIAGDGPERPWLLKAIKNLPWVHYFGMLKNEEKAYILSSSKFLINPGLVGLIVLDSFSYGVPIFTTNIDYHSPEFDYISSGINGVVTFNNVDDFANCILKYCADSKSQASLVSGCKESSKKYSFANMVNNFQLGINCVIK